MSEHRRTSVLVVGGGPVGLATAIELDHHGIASIVVEPREAVSYLRPRAETTSVRTMELFRRWGLAETIRQVYAGESSISPKVATKLLMEFGQRGTLNPQGASLESAGTTGAAGVAGAVGTRGGESDLSQREIEVLRLLARGESTREIGDRLALAEGTVKNYVSNILMKLHAANRTQAANLARERGLI